MTATIQPETKTAPSEQQALARQYVNFMFFRVDRAFRSESAEAKAEAKREFAEIVRRYTGPMMILPYSTLGLKPHEGQEGRRTRIVPGKKPFLFVYPFVKTRDWYLLPMPERQRIMNEHIAIGHKYPRVKINTTYSFGLDDQDFVVAFEADVPAEFLDLVQELRETESSKYTVRDTPMYTCHRSTIEEILEGIG